MWFPCRSFSKVFICSSRASLKLRALFKRENSLVVYNGGAGFFPRDPLEGCGSYLTDTFQSRPISPHKSSFVCGRQLGLCIYSAQLASGLYELSDVSLSSEIE